MKNLLLDRRRFAASSALALVPNISAAARQSSIQPAMFESELWSRSELSREFASLLRRKILYGPASEHFVGARRTQDTLRRQLRFVYTMELAHDGFSKDAVCEVIALEIETDLRQYREIFNRNLPIQLVSLDNMLLIDSCTLQPIIGFYIALNPLPFPGT
jgi:hypothetical protein